MTALADEVLVLEAADGQEVRIPYAALSRLLVDRGIGSRESSSLKGAAIGGLAGIIIGAAIGYSYGDDPCGAWDIICFEARHKAVFRALMGTGAGLVFGGIGGALIPGRNWESVRLPLSVTGAAVPTGGSYIGVSLSF